MRAKAFWQGQKSTHDLINFDIFFFPVQIGNGRYSYALTDLKNTYGEILDEFEKLLEEAGLSGAGKEPHNSDTNLKPENQDSSIKTAPRLRGQKGNSASAFRPFAPVESFLVANLKVSMRERRSRGDVNRVVTSR